MKFKNIFLLLFVMSLISSSCTTPKPDGQNPKTQVDESKPKNVTDNDQKKPAVLNRRQIVDSVMMKRYEAAKTEKPTTEQKATGTKICDCMNEIEIFSKVVKAKSQEDFNELAGDDKYKEVLALQNCHNNIMRPIVKGMDLTDGGIYAFKARTYLEKQCMKSNPQLWFYIGKYIMDHRPIN